MILAGFYDFYTVTGFDCYGFVFILIKLLHLMLLLFTEVRRKKTFIMKTCPCNIQRFLSAVKIENFNRKNIFNIFAENIHCEYKLTSIPTLYMYVFDNKRKKNRHTLAYPSFSI